MSLMGKCCCGCQCNCFPSSLYVSVPAYTNGSDISWSAFNQTVYRCCIVNQQVPPYYGGIIGSRPCVIYKLNPVLSGTCCSPVRNTYLTMAITASNYLTGSYRTSIWAIPQVYSFLNSSGTACVIPRDNYTSGTACYGLGVDEFCGPTKTYDLEGYPDTYFKSSGSLSGCNCSTTPPPYGDPRLTNWIAMPAGTNINSSQCTIATGSYTLDGITPSLTVTIT